MEAIRAAGLKLGVDPLGGAAVHYWQPIADTYGLDITVTNPAVDPTFRFMTLDHDGKIRMDCSSPYAMASLVKLKDRFDIAFGNDPDSDRHGIVTPSTGLMNPNHYLAVAIRLPAYPPARLARARPGRQDAGQQQPDRPRRSRRWAGPLCEVPVGFKWFAPGLFDGSFCFGGEESAGASFLRRDGTVWTTDKDGPILDLLAAEILARTGKDPGEHYRELTAAISARRTTRGSTPRRRPSRRRGFRSSIRPTVKASDLAGEPIIAKLTRAPGNNAPIGGLKVVAAERLVRRPALRHREHLQDLRRELPRPGPPRRHRRRSPADRRRRTDLTGDPHSAVRDFLGIGNPESLSRIGNITMNTPSPLARPSGLEGLCRLIYQKMRDLHLRQLFADDPGRGERLTAEAAGLFLDYSKNRVTDETLKLLLQLAEESDLRARIDAMFRGEKINVTENRAVLHVALRAPEGAVDRGRRRGRGARGPRRARQDGRLLPARSASGAWKGTPASGSGTSSTSASAARTSGR